MQEVIRSAGLGSNARHFCTSEGLTLNKGPNTIIFGKIYSDVAHHEYYLILAGLAFFCCDFNIIIYDKIKKICRLNKRV